MLEGEELVGHYVRILEVEHPESDMNYLLGNVYQIESYEKDSIRGYEYYFNDDYYYWVFTRVQIKPIVEESELGRVIYGV